MVVISIFYHYNRCVQWLACRLIAAWFKWMELFGGESLFFWGHMKIGCHFTYYVNGIRVFRRPLQHLSYQWRGPVVIVNDETKTNETTRKMSRFVTYLWCVSNPLACYRNQFVVCCGLSYVFSNCSMGLIGITVNASRSMLGDVYERIRLLPSLLCIPPTECVVVRFFHPFCVFYS